MRNLLRLVRKFSFILVFIFLEVFAYVLLTRKNHFHEVALLNSTNGITGTAFSMYGNVRHYFLLQHENDLLKEENARLRQQLLTSYKKVYKFQTLRGDTTLEQAFQFIPARVINNSVLNANNYFTLDIGSRYGVYVDMGVISPSGIAGVVKGVSANFAVCISVLNTTINKFSVKVQKSGEDGILEWQGKNAYTATVRNIPTNVDLSVGDTIVTRGFSHIFPEDIMVGTVEDFNVDPKDGFYVITIRLSTNFHKLSDVYVVDYKYKKELDAIQDSLMR